MNKTVRLEQAEIALDDIGDGDPVLLLHGFPATRHLWSQVAPMLAAAGFRVLVPDLAGYGASEAAATESVGMARQARWMFELLDALGIGRAAVVAHDVGSAAAQLMVANAPNRTGGSLERCIDRAAGRTFHARRLPARSGRGALRLFARLGARSRRNDVTFVTPTFGAQRVKLSESNEVVEAGK
jgi:pimeloyl-ACP methyl ester carboxylesterase